MWLIYWFNGNWFPQARREANWKANREFTKHCCLMHTFSESFSPQTIQRSSSTAKLASVYAHIPFVNWVFIFSKKNYKIFQSLNKFLTWNLRTFFKLLGRNFGQRLCDKSAAIRRPCRGELAYPLDRVHCITICIIMGVIHWVYYNFVCARMWGQLWFAAWSCIRRLCGERKRMIERTVRTMYQSFVCSKSFNERIWKLSGSYIMCQHIQQIEGGLSDAIAGTRHSLVLCTLFVSFFLSICQKVFFSL